MPNYFGQMKQLIVFALGLTIFVRCTRTERSSIEKVMVDTSLIQTFKADYDTFYTEKPEAHDLYKVEIYENDSSNMSLVFKDSLDHIQAIRIIKNNVNIFVQEYYPNGQAKGKTDFLPGKIHGLGVYYYQDGRIKTKGQWTNGKMTGEWKNYNEDGFLTSIELLDENGELIKKEVVK